MKTVSELQAWCEGAAEAFGDPSVPVGQIFVRYQENRQPSPLIVAHVKGDELLLDLSGDVIPLKINATGPVAGADRLQAFGIREVTPGVWFLTPSLNIPGLVHVFVILYDVPSPAPWERLIVLPGAPGKLVRL